MASISSLQHDRAEEALQGARSLQELASTLSQLDYTFDEPQLELEQYHTPPDVAARFLWTIRDDIIGKECADLGTGQGILGIGARILGASRVVGFEVDPHAAEKAIRNASPFNKIDIEVCDVKKTLPASHFLQFDTVITNPPFGTKSKKADIKFLSAALKLARRAVYSLHKSTTQEYLLSRAAKWGLQGTIIAEINYPLPRTYALHRKDEVEVKVCLLRLIKPDAVMEAERLANPDLVSSGPH